MTSTAGSEPEVVSKANPTISTTAGGTIVVGSGAKLTDSATLSGGASPTGTLTFTLTSPGGPVVDTETVTVNGAGTYTTPNGYLPSAVGTYQWSASYSGDANNNGVASAPGSEPETVVQGSLNPPIQVDDNNANNNKSNGNGTFTLSGTSSAKNFGWVTTAAAAAFDGSEQVHASSATDTADATWSYVLNVPTAGGYAVYASWAPAPGNATNATYKIYIESTKGGPVATASVNQMQSPTTAVMSSGTLIQLLATIPVPAGTHTITVVLSDVANGNVVADGIFDPPVGGARGASAAMPPDVARRAPSPPAFPMAPPDMAGVASAPVGDAAFNSMLLTASDPTPLGRFDAPSPDAGAADASSPSLETRASDQAFASMDGAATDVAALDRVFASTTADGDGGWADLTGPMDAPWLGGSAGDAF